LSFEGIQGAVSGAIDEALTADIEGVVRLLGIHWVSMVL
jgi:hypothetical protein